MYLVDARSGVSGHRIGVGLCRSRDGIVSVRGHDVGY